MKHKWHKEIKAWADGAEIEVWDMRWHKWVGVEDPTWEYEIDEVKYRIKPQDICKCQKQTCSALKEPQYLYVFQTNEGIELGIANSITRVKTLNAKFKYIGKIKLEVNDD